MASSQSWVSQPEHSDEAIRDATGLSWDEWVSRIDAGPGRDASHSEIAAWLGENSDIGGWWAQGVTVGYERITGKRLPGQMPDGTFSVSRSRTFAVAPEHLRERLEDDASRATLLPELVATRSSKPGVKSPRFALTDTADADAASLGTLQFAFDATSTGTRLTVTHEKLASLAVAEEWKERWAQWLADLDDQLRE